MKAEIEKISITYSQEEDGCDISNNFQELKIFTNDAGSGKFIVFETKRWALDDIEELIEILNDFKLKANLTTI
jgi:hypothetical protein